MSLWRAPVEGVTHLLKKRSGAYVVSLNPKGGHMTANAVNGVGRSSYGVYLSSLEEAHRDHRESLEHKANRSSSPEEIVGFSAIFQQDPNPQPKRYSVLGSGSAARPSHRQEPVLRRERQDSHRNSHKSYRSHPHEHRVAAPHNSHSAASPKSGHHLSSSNTDNSRGRVSQNPGSISQTQQLRLAHERIGELFQVIRLAFSRLEEARSEYCEVREELRRARETNLELFNKTVEQDELLKAANEQIESLGGRRVQYPSNPNERQRLILSHVQRTANEPPRPIPGGAGNVMVQPQRLPRGHEFQSEPGLARRGNVKAPDDDIEPGAQPGCGS